MCHEKWRQYHNTTYSPENSDGGGPPRGLAVIEPRRQRQSRQIFCFNCARKGHFGHLEFCSHIFSVPYINQLNTVIGVSKGAPKGRPLSLTPYIAVYDEINQLSRKRKRGGRRQSDSRGGQGLLGPAPPTTPVMNKNSSRRSGLIQTDKDQTAVRNATEGKQTRERLVCPRTTCDESRLWQIRTFKFATFSLPHPPPPPPPQFFTPPNSSHFNEGDCSITFIQPPPGMSLSEPQRRRNFYHEQRLSVEPRPPNVHYAEQDFPRTPFSPPQTTLLPRNPRNHTHHEDFLGPPPAKLTRRESEPFDQRWFRSNTHDPQFHEQPALPSDGYYHERSPRHVSSPLASFEHRHRLSGSERGFRGSELAVSLMDTRHRRNSYHGGRTSHYGHQ
ncbi:hypothetical protein GBAR_LOCUS12035 [Geodia barretti]|nr:hypothetical protein GBAR_LOCUS12035 [Geodia barretti]